MLGTRVEGGTGAGSRRPLKQAGTWTCSCPAEGTETVLFALLEHPSWRTRCERCGVRKP